MFENVAIFDELMKRADEKTKYYSCYIMPVFYDMKTFLENIKANFKEYPDHGIEHSRRILEKLSLLLDQDTISDMSSLEIVVLILSALFHDSAMALFNSKEDKETIRKEHHKMASIVINKYFDEYLMNIPHQQRIRNAVIFVCEAHNLTLDELVMDDRFDNVDTVDTFDIRYGVLAFLLRIGDLMDFDADRINHFRMVMYSDAFSEEALDHNKRSLKVDYCQIKPYIFEIKVFAETINQYLIWSDWFAYLKQDIEKFNALYAGKYFRLPIPKTTIKKNDCSTYEVKKLGLKIDNKGDLWNIFAKSIYTYELDFLRELIQNSIDASLKKIYLDININLDHSSPRTWGKYSKGVKVIYSSTDQTLCVIDYGIGMDESDLNRYLFTISESGKTNCKKRKFNFPGIAQFGIGFVSCLNNSEKVEVYTSKKKNVIYKATLGCNSNYALVERFDNDVDYIGTTVVLKLKKRHLGTAIDNYLKSTFSFTSVPIFYYDIDRVAKIVGKRKSKSISTILKEKPYSFDYAFCECSSKIDEKTKKLLDEIRCIEHQFEEYKKRHLFIIELYKNRDRFKAKSKNPWVDLNEISPREENPIYNDFLLKMGSPLYYSRELNSRLKNYYNKIKAQTRSRIESLNNEVCNNCVPIVFGNMSLETKSICKYTFIESNHNPNKLSSMPIKSEHPFPLNNSQGILLINQSIYNYDLGVECIAISGLLIDNGKIVHSLKIEKNILNKTEYINYRGINNFEKILYDDFFPAFSDIDRLSLSKYSRYLLDAFTLEQTTNKSEENHINIVNELINNKFSLYQDGIKISSYDYDLFPIGDSHLFLNLTANARYKLNVTRHDISENATDLEEWFIHSGEYIQRTLLCGILSSLKDFRLDYSNALYEDCELEKYRKDNCIFDRLAKTHFRKIIAEYSNK